MSHAGFPCVGDLASIYPSSSVSPASCASLVLAATGGSRLPRTSLWKGPSYDDVRVGAMRSNSGTWLPMALRSRSKLPRLSGIYPGGATDPRHVLQKNGGLADLWYMDDGDILCQPVLVPSPATGIRRRQHQSWSGAESSEYRSHPLRERPGCSTSMSGDSVTCRTRPRSPQSRLEASHSESLSDLHSTSRTGSWPRQTPSELCTDPQTECALLRERLGVSRIIHILRVHGHTILQEQRAAELYDEV